MQEYAEYDAVGLAELVARDETTARELLDEALRRVESLNPRLNAVVHAEEGAAQKLVQSGQGGKFRGVPFLLKDLGAEAADFPSHLGSRLFRDTRHGFDSELYARLRRAGLIVFGRTTSPELGIGPVTEAKVYGGPTRNPWNTERTPGGSSGGAGAAVAAGIVPAAHGSDGGGSVRIPASCCGLVGFKPTRARLPDGPGAGEGWAGMAVDGFLTRSLRDTAALLDQCAGADLGAPYRAPPLERGFAAAIDAPPGRLRVAVLERGFAGEPVHEDCRAAVRRAATLLEEIGCEVDEAKFDISADARAMASSWTAIIACGTALSVCGKIGEGDPDPDQVEGATLGAVRMARGVSGADYLRAVNSIHSFGRRMAALFQDFDILATPVLAEPPARIGRFKPDNSDFADYRSGPRGVFKYSPFTAAFNASGQPAVSLPLHWGADGLPIGVQLAAAFGRDETLTSVAAELERAAPWRERQQSLIRRLGAAEEHAGVA